MRRMGRWFAVKMVGAEVVGVVWLPKFPRTSAEFPPSAAATHVPASVISQCQVGTKKPPSTAFIMSVCAFYDVAGCYHPQISFREQLFQETRAYLGREKHKRSDKSSSAVESQCRATEQRGFLPTSASAMARNYLGSRLTWKGSHRHENVILIFVSLAQVHDFV